MYCGNSCFDFYDGDIKMNERIKELADQVGAVHNVLAMGRHDGVLFTETELEKFAELIVKECALLCSDPVVVLQHFGLDSKSE